MNGEPTEFRQSIYNIVIPLSSQVVKSDTPLYIVANPLSGIVSLMDERERTVLQEFPHIHDDTVVSSLKSAKYITHLTEEEEKSLMEKKYADRKKPTDPKAGIVVTYQCNLRCTYCWTEHLFKNDTRWMNAIINEKMVDAAFTAIDTIPTLKTLSTLSFYGGEPFLPSTMPIVKYILENRAQRDYSFHANTNGYFLKQFTPLLSQYSITGLGVTLDGIPVAHNKRRKRIDGSGSFHQIVGGIDTALDAGITIGVRINSDGENFDQLPAFGDWIKEHGWAHRKGISFTVCPIRAGKSSTPSGILTYFEMNRRIIDLFEEPSMRIMRYEWEYIEEGYLARTVMDGSGLKPRPFYCNAHCQGYLFDPFGDVYSCPRGVGDRTFSIGKFFPELAFDSNYEHWFSRDVLSIPQCRECDLALVCGGGCAYEAFLEYNTIYKGFCEHYKSFVEYGLPFFVRRKMEVNERDSP